MLASVGVIVRVNPSSVRLTVLEESSCVRLRIVISAPKVAPDGAVVTAGFEKMISVEAPGTRPWFAPPEVATQLLRVLPFEAAHPAGSPGIPP